jgi:hypothetical protein
MAINFSKNYKNFAWVKAVIIWEGDFIAILKILKNLIFFSVFLNIMHVKKKAFP